MKKICVALLAILMLFLTACGESKEEYIEKCQVILSHDEFKSDPEKYLGKTYRMEGMVMSGTAYEDELSEDGHKIYKFVVAGTSNTAFEGKRCAVSYYEDITDQGIQFADKVVMYGEFAGMSNIEEYPILFAVKYLELDTSLRP